MVEANEIKKGGIKPSIKKNWFFITIGGVRNGHAGQPRQQQRGALTLT